MQEKNVIMTRMIKQMAAMELARSFLHIHVLLIPLELPVYALLVAMESKIMESHVMIKMLMMEMDVHQPVKLKMDSFALRILGRVLVLLLSVEMEFKVDKKFVTME